MKIAPIEIPTVRNSYRTNSYPLNFLPIKICTDWMLTDWILTKWIKPKMSQDFYFMYGWSNKIWTLSANILYKLDASISPVWIDLRTVLRGKEVEGPTTKNESIQCRGAIYKNKPWRPVKRLRPLPTTVHKLSHKGLTSHI